MIVRNQPPARSAEMRVRGVNLDSPRTRTFSNYKGMRRYLCSDERSYRLRSRSEAYLHSDPPATSKSSKCQLSLISRGGGGVLAGA